MNQSQRLVQHLSSVENVHRTNSLAIDLSTIYGRDMVPNRLEMFKFVNKQLGLKAEELVDIQNHPFLPQVFVKVKTEAILERVQVKLTTGVKVYQKNVILYGWRCDIPLTTVKVNGANPDTSREKIMEVMSKYGVVSSCERGRIDYFRDSFVSDGTWILRIRPEQGKGLPSIVYFTENGNTDVWSLIFDGKVSICWKCGQENHRGDMCRSVRPKANQQGKTAPVGLGTYCDVVKEGLAEEWVGMTNTKPNLSKQKSLVQARPQQVVKQTNISKGKMLAPPAVLSKKWQSVSTDMVARTGYTSMVSHRTGDLQLAINTSNKYSVLAHAGLGDMGAGESDDSEEFIEDENIEIKTGEVKKTYKRRISNANSGRGVKPRKDDVPDTFNNSAGGGDRAQNLFTPEAVDDSNEESMEVNSENLLDVENENGDSTFDLGSDGGQHVGHGGPSGGGEQQGGVKQRFVGGHPLGVGGVRDEGKQFYTDSQPTMTSPSLLSDGENSSKDSALITQH